MNDQELFTRLMPCGKGTVPFEVMCDWCKKEVIHECYIIRDSKHASMRAYFMCYECAKTRLWPVW